MLVVVSIYNKYIFNIQSNLSFVEPVYFVGEGEYNLNILKEIEVTNAFLDLGPDHTGCQDGDNIQNCTTKNYMDSLLKRCGCLPFSISTSDKVTKEHDQI